MYWYCNNVYVMPSLCFPCRTPLHYAAANGRYECTVTLVSAGAEVNEPDQTGCTPLHYSAASQAFSRSENFLSVCTKAGEAESPLFVEAQPWNNVSLYAVKMCCIPKLMSREMF